MLCRVTESGLGLMLSGKAGEGERGIMEHKRAGEQSPLAMLARRLRPHLPVLSLALGLMLLQSVATLLQPWLGGLLANRLAGSQGFGWLPWALFAAVVVQQAVGYIAGVQLQRVTVALGADISSEVYGHLQALPLSWHQARERGDVLALVSGDADRLGYFVTGSLVPLLPMLVTFAGALAMMVHLSPVIAAAVAVLMPLMFVLLKLVGRRLRPMGKATVQAWADRNAVAEQNLGLLPLIKAFTTEPVEHARFRDQAFRLRDTEFARVRLQSAITPVVHVAGAGAVLLLLGVAGPLIVRQDMGLGALVSLFLYGMVLVRPLSQLANVYGATQSARGAAERLLDAMHAPVEVDAGTRTELPRAADIEYRDVDFAYPGRPPLLQGFNLRIGAGETVALTGVNGAGKSTLAHLLLRLLEPQGGCILVGGIDVREFRLSALRGQVGLVAQDVMLFNASVAENIAYGCPGASAEAIQAAASTARAHDFVAALPDGYATVVGDRGVRLSGGQKQRIALARALLHDPAILVLDEATAMFDPQGEAEFIAGCRDALRSRTVILITHRPASLALADRVLHMGEGRIHAAGTG